MNFLLCQSCGQHYWMTESHCPHCHTSSKTRWVKGSTNAAVTLLLGLGLVGCRNSSDDKDTLDSSDPIITEPAYGVVEVDTGTDTAIDTAVGDLYGVPDSDNDADGFDVYEDCDDNDPNTFPGSAELESTTDCMKDADGDGYGDSNPTNPNVTAGTDCDDTDPNVFPGQGC